MRVLLATSGVEFGGAEHYLSELGKELRHAGHHVVLACPKAIAHRFPHDAFEIVTGAFDWAWGPEDSDGGAEFAAKVADQREAFAATLAASPSDVVFLNANWPTHYAGCLQACCAIDVPFGVHFHLCPHTIPLNAIAREIHAACLPRAAFLTAVAVTARFFVEQTFGRLLNVGVIVNGGRFEIGVADHAALMKSKREKILFSMGRLEHQKGYVDIAPALKVPGALVDYKMKIAGEGPMADLLTAVIGPTNRAVEFLGQISDVESRLTRYDAFVLPSHFEGMSLAILEAMSCGCIPIVSDASSASEVITDGREGFLFRVGDWRSFLLAFHRFHASDKSEVRRRCLDRSLGFTRKRMFDEMVARLVSAQRAGFDPVIASAPAPKATKAPPAAQPQSPQKKRKKRAAL